MSVKAKLPKEDPETVARREAAESRAEAGRIEETQDNLSAETRSIVRQFGRFAGRLNPRSLAPSASPGRNAFANAFAQRSAGSSQAFLQSLAVTR